MKRNNRSHLLIKKAAQLFLKNSYEKTTINDIGRAIGIKGPAIYHYVSSKEELLSLVFRAAAEKWQKQLTDKVDEVDDPEEKVRVLIRNGIDLCLSEGEIPLLLDAPVESLSKKETKAYKTQAKENVKFVESVLRGLKISKGVEDSIDLTIATFILISISVWVYKWYNPKGRISQEELVDGITKFFLRGFIGEEK